MAIKLTRNGIQIGNHFLKEEGDGIVFTGVMRSVRSTGIPYNVPYQIGSNFGYVVGGKRGNFPTSFISPFSNTVDRFPFSSDTNATDFADLTAGKARTTSTSSDVSVYTAGGISSSPPIVAINVIEKFQFSSGGLGTDVGDLLTPSSFFCSVSSSTHGYTTGGYATPTALAPPFGVLNTIQKYSFASNGNATDVGDLTLSRLDQVASGSSVSGYSSGGRNTPTTARNTIDKFPFATDANATDVGDLFQNQNSQIGLTSPTSGYVCWGLINNSTFNANVERFPFASDSNSVIVGVFSQSGQVPSNTPVTFVNPRALAAGSSSSFYGYMHGGGTSPVPTLNTIQKFPFASEISGTASISGFLATPAVGSAGHSGSQS